ncbi:MAG: L,D-transpeptidase family protein [Acetobacteraceae bacterium]|nr:L,D-transpeptidase family protein [Acetobacteraceae bacterium]
MTEAVVHPDGRVVFAGQTVRAALGRGGVRAHADKREGDGATPSGLLAIRRVLYRADRLAPPVAAVPIEPIAPEDGWCDDPSHPDYNRMVRLPHSARHEALWRQDALYDLIGVLGWNDAPVERGRGSAIFLHVARADGAPTEGCIALAKPDLCKLLAAGITALAVRGA